MFGQIIPRRGFRDMFDNALNKTAAQYKSMRTPDLKDERNAELERLDDSN